MHSRLLPANVRGFILKVWNALGIGAPDRLPERTLAAEVGAALALTRGKGIGADLALEVLSWLTGRRDPRVHSLRELRRRLDELLELREAESNGLGVWKRRREWGWK